MPDLIPAEAVQAAAEALAAHPWNSYPHAAHGEHNFDVGCLVCQADLGPISRVALEAAAPVLAAQVRREYEDLLGSIWLYIGWRYVTKQLTTPQKNLFADAVEADLKRGDAFEDGEAEAAVDRWWDDDASARQIGEDR